MLEDGTVEIVWLLAGLALGVVAGWFLWARLGSTRLESEFSAREQQLDSRLQAAHGRVAEAEVALDETREQLKAAKAEAKDLGKQLEKAKSRSEKLRADHTEARDALEAAEGRLTEMADLRAALEESRAATASIKEKASAMAERLGEVEDLRSRLVSAQDRLVEAERAKETARIRAAEAEEITERATVELEAAMQNLSRLREAAEENLTLRRDLDRATDRVAQLEQNLSARSGEMADLREQLASAAIVSVDDQATVATEAHDIEPEATDDAPDPEPEASEKATDPEPESTEHREMGAPDDADATEEPVEEGTAVPGEDQREERDVAVARMSEVAARTAGGADPPDDDLKKIHGVGPKLEQLLKGMGITSYLQVANLTPEDIETVTLALDAFPGRIERDDWVGSADALYRAQYEPEE